MAIRTVLVCEAQVPFVSGGAERLTRQLVTELRRRGYQAELASIPFKWYPPEELLSHAAAWRMVDLTESNGVKIDLLIATKFPTYFARHPNKVTWLLHQYRAAYDLCGTPYGEFGHTDLDVGLRERLLALDRRMLGESRGLYTIARNVSDRLERYNGLLAEPIYHPPALAGRLEPGPSGNYVLALSRLEPAKRIDLAIRAMKLVGDHLRLVVVGDGTQLDNLRRLAEAEGVAGRVDFRGVVDDEEVVRLYAGALAVVFAPFDEDYGYVTLEAFLAGKPVITARDSGGPLEFVEDGVNGIVCDPDPSPLAAAMARLDGGRREAEAMGARGLARARAITWDAVVNRLVGQVESVSPSEGPDITRG
jgi:glycosyltransferase involved in cell wall biosynthesis